jgi:hypothetical protein
MPVRQRPPRTNLRLHRASSRFDTLYQLKCGCLFLYLAFPNVSRDKNREGLIVRYSPFALKSGMTAIGRELEARGAMEGRSSILRQLLGMSLADGSINVFE